MLAAGYGLHFYCCATSVLPRLTLRFTSADAFGNLEWAGGILQQGWLNPNPHYPYHAWMRRIMSFEDWVSWWGNPAVFLRSPLYAYLLAGALKISGNLIWLHFLQSLMGGALCVLMGVWAGTVFESRRTGWLAFGIAACYGPFYCHSWPLLRDPLVWNLMTGSMILLVVWWRRLEKEAPSPWLSMGTGMVLGAGLLAHEGFGLMISMVLVLGLARKRPVSFRMPWVWLVLGVAVAVLPLVVRNIRVGAPFLSSSNRFAEGFVVGNAASASPNHSIINRETSGIYRQTDGKTWSVVRATFATYGQHPERWLWLQGRKLLSLFDPFESPDNLNLYFMKEISPMVRWGIPHWWIFIPGLGGLLLGCWRKDSRVLWFGLLLFCLSASFALAPIVSRFRQTFMIVWIPLAANLFVTAWEWMIQGKWRQVLLTGLFLAGGWGLCLGPLSLQPRRDYYRPNEYRMASQICEEQGRTGEAQAFLDLLQRRIQAAER